MNSIKYKSWDEVPIKVYREISEVCLKENLEPLDKNISILSILLDEPEEKLWDLDITEAQKLFNQISWVWSFKFNKKWHGKKLKINGRSYDISSDLEKFSVSQYIDFQMLWPKLKESDSVYSQILATLIIPEGHKYNSGYDIKEVIQEIETHLPITQANSVLYFFLISLARSIRATEICYNLLMKILKRQAKTKEEKEGIEMMRKEVMKQINEAQHIFGFLS